MTVQELGEYWMRRRLEEARAPATGEPRSGGDGGVSMQTLAGYQTALSQFINPRLGGLRLTEARTGVVDEALARVDHAGRTTRVTRSVLAQMFALAVRHDALTSNPMREVRPSPRRRRAVKALSVEQARDLLRLTRSHQDGVARDEAGLLTGGAKRTSDLHEVVLLLLGTGMRIGEALALPVGLVSGLPLPGPPASRVPGAVRTRAHGGLATSERKTGRRASWSWDRSNSWTAVSRGPGADAEANDELTQPPTRAGRARSRLRLAAHCGPGTHDNPECIERGLNVATGGPVTARPATLEESRGKQKCKRCFGG